MKKYYVTGGGIVTKEIKRETDASVWLSTSTGTIREAKKTSWSAYCDTFDEALSWASERAERDIALAKRRMFYAEEYAQKVKDWGHRKDEK